jgi:hypothetical protein
MTSQAASQTASGSLTGLGGQSLASARDGEFDSRNERASVSLPLPTEQGPIVRRRARLQPAAPIHLLTSSG